MNRHKKPKTFDRNLIIIGAGSAGLVCAYIAAMAKAKVSLIEKQSMGGDCLNTGCVPSKALIRTARVLAEAKRAGEFGLKKIHVEFDFAEVMERIQRVIKTIEPNDSVARYTELGVDCIQGEARITTPYSVEVNGGTMTTRSIIIAAGARPWVPPIPGIEKSGYLTSDSIWSLRELPERLVILGGGPIGTELAQCFSRLGSKVTQVEMQSRILSTEDPDISAILMDKFSNEGIEVLVDHHAREIRNQNNQQLLVCESKGQEIEIAFDKLLVAVGRKANTEAYGLEEMGIPLNKQGTIKTNNYLQTCYPGIFACGDVAGPYQFTHTAAHQAWYASVNALFGKLKKFKVDYSVIPHATFTDPEVARVGLNETEARKQGIPYEVTTFKMDHLDRAITDEAAYGQVKVLTRPGKDRILGATIIADHASELITEHVSAMRNGSGLSGILSAVHIYPSFSEANKFAAGVWKKSHMPVSLQKWAGRFHRWQRGG